MKSFTLFLTLALISTVCAAGPWRVSMSGDGTAHLALVDSEVYSNKSFAVAMMTEDDCGASGAVFTNLIPTKQISEVFNMEVRVDKRATYTVSSVSTPFPNMQVVMFSIETQLLRDLMEGTTLRIKAPTVEGTTQFDRYSLIGSRAQIVRAWRNCRQMKPYQGKSIEGSDGDQLYFDNSGEDTLW